MDKNELSNLIELLRTELNKIIDVAEMDLTKEAVLNKSRELDRYLNEYQKKYMN